MTNDLESGLRWLAQMQRKYCSSDVEYRRGSDSRTVPAVFGRTQYETTNEYGVRTGAFCVDFLIAAADLPFSPKSGDEVIADGHTYEVLEIGSEGCWRWSDPHRLTRRIHTKGV